MRVYLNHLRRRVTERARLLVNSISDREMTLTLLGYIVGVFSAIIVASCTAGSAHAAEPPTPQQPAPLPELSYAMQGGVLVLHRTQEGSVCIRQAMRAEFRHPDPAQAAAGCWKLAALPSGAVLVVVAFMDGDHAQIRAELFK